MKRKMEAINVIQLALIIGIIVLASNNQDGWGWLVFALILTL